MELLADTHVHIYPNHDAAALIRGAAERLQGAVRHVDAKIVLFLTEGHAYHFFERLLQGTHGLPASWAVTPCAEREAVQIRWSEGADVWIVAGRQIVTAERVEILALTLGDPCEDGRPAAEVVSAVNECGAVPVLAWAPGKWMFRRARVVRDLVQQFGPDRLRLGDTSLRPVGWPEPRFMREPGWKNVLAGSDPLPIVGEEAQAGGYGVRLVGEFDGNNPVTSLRRLLRSPETVIERIGSRNSPWQMARRLRSHHHSKQAS